MTRTIDLAVIAGDGIGPEVIAEAKKVLDWLVRHRRAPIDIDEENA